MFYKLTRLFFNKLAILCVLLLKQKPTVISQRNIHAKVMNS